MRAIHIDIETYCDLNIMEVGMFKYIAHNSFEIILFSYRWSDDLFTHTVDLLSGEEIPDEVVFHIIDEGAKKKAWNAFFEFTALKKFFKQKYKAVLRFINWICTMTKAAYNGYPLKLEFAAKATQLSIGKMAEGNKLIKTFCVPVKKPIKKYDFATRILPIHEPAKWELFKKYNNTDVETEVAIDYLLPLELPAFEQEIFELDYQINERGVQMDKVMIKRCLALIKEHFDSLFERSQLITGLDNPNSVKQLTKWLEVTTGRCFPTLRADAIEKILKDPGIDEDVKEVLAIRQELSLSSVKKYVVMYRMCDIAGIMKGLVQYYGASRTGRWAGRGVQVHNLPKQGSYKPEQITFMRSAVSPMMHDRATLTFMFSDILATLKLLLRTAFTAREGHYLVVSDWAAIEARILAWLANCKWRMDVFASGGDIYIASASKMFHIPIEKIGKPSKERDKGKVAELALGYQGWVPALIRMGALDMGLKELELSPIAQAWRAENPEIAHKQNGLWARCERAFKAAFEYPGKLIHFAERRLTVQYKGGTLLFTLPSGRQLVYPQAKLVDGKISYYGIDQVTKKLLRVSLYGGKIVENAVQGIARDVLVEGLKGINPIFPVVLHVHDEIAAECPNSVEEKEAIRLVNKIMTKTPTWAKGLLLKCDTFTSSYYRKN
jgi:DNA polymerase